MARELVFAVRLNAEKCLAPLFEPKLSLRNVQHGAIVQRHISDGLTLSGGHRIGELFAGDVRVWRLPANVADIDACAFDGIGGAGRIVEIC